MVRLQRTKNEKPLADKAAGWRQADDTQATDKKCGHGYRHALADTDHLTDIFFTRCHKYCTGAHEQGDLAECMHGNVHQSTHLAFRREQGCSQNYIGKLADGGKGQPAFQAVLGQGDERSGQDGEGGNVAQHGTEV